MRFSQNTSRFALYEQAKLCRVSEEIILRKLCNLEKKEDPRWCLFKNLKPDHRQWSRKLEYVRVKKHFEKGGTPPPLQPKPSTIDLMGIDRLLCIWNRLRGFCSKSDYLHFHRSLKIIWLSLHKSAFLFFFEGLPQTFSLQDHSKAR